MRLLKSISSDSMLGCASRPPFRNEGLCPGYGECCWLAGQLTPMSDQCEAITILKVTPAALKDRSEQVSLFGAPLSTFTSLLVAFAISHSHSFGLLPGWLLSWTESALLMWSPRGLSRSLAVRTSNHICGRSSLLPVLMSPPRGRQCEMPSSQRQPCFPSIPDHPFVL